MVPLGVIAGLRRVPKRESASYFVDRLNRTSHVLLGDGVVDHVAHLGSDFLALPPQLADKRGDSTRRARQFFRPHHQ